MSAYSRNNLFHNKVKGIGVLISEQKHEKDEKV